VAPVHRLVARRFPQWAGLRITPVRSAGTDNDLFRLGDTLAVRLPRHPGAVALLEREWRWLPWLAPRLPLAVPVPVARGEPDAGYATGVDDATWTRGRAWALWLGLGAVLADRERNPVLADAGRRALREVVGDAT
jgi:hypothetical protein